MKPTLLSLFIISIFLIPTFVQGQVDPLAPKSVKFNWSKNAEKKEKEVMQNVLYSDYYKAKDYPNALKELQYLLDNKPDLNRSIYQRGVNIHEKLAKANKDQARYHQDEALKLLGKRMVVFNDSSAVLDRFALKYYLLYKDEKSRWDELQLTFERSFAMMGDKVISGLPLAYFNLLKQRAQKEKPDQERVMSNYNLCKQILSSKIEKEADDLKLARLKEYDETIDRLLSEVLFDNIDCDFIANQLKPQLLSQPEDLALNKRYVLAVLQVKCPKDDTFKRAAKQVLEVESDYGLARLIGLMLLDEGNLKESRTFLKTAYEVAKDDTQRADIHMVIGKIDSKEGNFAKGRFNFIKAYELDGKKKYEALSQVARLYMQSGNTCKKLQSQLEDRACYLAAYDVFAEAGNTKGMEMASKQFPSMTDIFQDDYSVGDRYSVGCWINIETRIRKRP